MPLTRIARDRGVPLRTLRRWSQRYRQRGLGGLVRSTRSDAGRRKLPRELHLLIEGLALRQPRLSHAAVWRQAAAIAEQQNWPVPSYSWVYDIIRRLDPALVTLAHEGPVGAGGLSGEVRLALPSRGHPAQ